MKQFFDFFPVALFFIAYSTSKDFMLATKVIIVASTIQISGYWLWKRKVEKLHIGTFIVVVTLGGLTLYLDNPLFLVWKPTIVNWGVAITFIVGLALRKNFVKKAVEGFLTQAPHLKLELPENKWTPICYVWIIFFTTLGFLNLYIYFQFGEVFWGFTFK